MNMMTAQKVLVCLLLGMGSALAADQAAPVAPAAATPATAEADAGPHIQFQTPVYDFGKVKSGEPVKYTYFFTNSGDALLIVSNVQPSCGCTTAGEWSHQVEPGKTGTIPVQFNSANYGGAVMKTITVTSNDKKQHSIGLQLKGTIWKPVDVQPMFAVMTIPPDATNVVTTTVHIANNMEEPITLSAPESNNKTFTAELKTNTVGKDFQMVISAHPPFEQPSLQGQITMKTSATNAPTISVTAWANVQQAVVVSPPQVMIGAGPLASKQTVNVTIQNNGSAPLTLSEPTVDNKDAEVKLSEVNTGRTFTATLTFPEGFDLQGTKAAFTVKSSHPRHPVISVPISQVPKPVITPVSQPAIVPLTAPPTLPGVPPAPPASGSAAK